MRLDAEIPQLLPMNRKVTVTYLGVQALYSRCNGKHVRRVCQSRNLEWIDYVKWFVTKNDHIEEEMFGRWIAILTNDPRQ